MEGNPFNWTWTSSKSPVSDDAYVVSPPRNVSEDIRRSPAFYSMENIGSNTDNVNEQSTSKVREDENDSISSLFNSNDEASIHANNNNNDINNTVGEETVEHDENKVSRATLTDIETDDTQSKTCKYCKARLSKLRWLERVKSRKRRSLRRRNVSSPCESANKSCQTSASLFEKAEMTQKELQSIAMILRFKCGRTSDNETFCKCVMLGKARDCRCGEEDKCIEWVWDWTNRPQATNLLENGCLALFHKDYSCGTAAVRGQTAMTHDQHFWEIKMTTPVYGTDMMVGIGTDDTDLNSKANTFCSMLGNDTESWGLSYDGRIHHNKRKVEYCGRFVQGAIIGVHLDMWHGTLSFFKNRQPLGTAFTGLRGRSIYPMACSTAARSGMKIISSRSFPTSLQFMCCQTLRRIVPSHLSVLDTLAMPPGLRAFLANNMTWLLHALPPKFRRLENQDFICSICMPLKSVLEGLTDDEDSDDEKAGDLHLLKLAEDDNESDDVDENEEGECNAEHFHTQLQPYSHDYDMYGTIPRRRIVSGNSPFTNPHSSDFFSRLKRHSTSDSKRRKLDFAAQGYIFEEDESSSEEDEDKYKCCEKEETEEVSLGNSLNDSKESTSKEGDEEEYESGLLDEAGLSTSKKRKRV